jgi:hypothetical protein
MKNYINCSLTIPKGYVVLDSAQGVRSQNIQKILKLAQHLEKSNLVMTSELCTALATLSDNDYKTIEANIKKATRTTKGQFLKSSFASGANLEDEQMTIDDLALQFYEYFMSYGIGRVPTELFEEDVSRRIEAANIVKRKEKKELNNTFKLLDVKTSKEFQNDVAIIVGSPIVWGEQQKEFLREAHRNNLLIGLLK